jgi:GNAT superfamily N-acetyltransferase
VKLIEEPLTETGLGEVIAFMRRSNPFAQHTWGWDTGRFIDWRWGSNSLRERAQPGWFSRHCRVFREGPDIAAVAVREYGEHNACIITGSEDTATVSYVLLRLMDDHAGRGIGLSLDVLDEAEWLHPPLRDHGLVRTPGAGHEWEYDLTRIGVPPPTPEGFAIDSLASEQPGDVDGIAACIGAAFGSASDLRSAMSSIRCNPMFEPALSVFARSPDGRIAAYCRGTADPDNGVCGIDPVATHPDFQRLGLGKAVVLTCLAAQRAMGGRFTYIGSGPGPAAGTHLYRALGPSRRFDYSSWSTPQAAAPMVETLPRVPYSLEIPNELMRDDVGTRATRGGHSTPRSVSSQEVRFSRWRGNHMG